LAHCPGLSAAYMGAAHGSVSLGRRPDPLAGSRRDHHGQMGIQRGAVGHADPSRVVVGQPAGTRHAAAAHAYGAAARSDPPPHAEPGGARPVAAGSFDFGAGRNHDAAADRLFTVRGLNPALLLHWHDAGGAPATDHAHPLPDIELHVGFLCNDTRLAVIEPDGDFNTGTLSHAV